MKNIFITLLLCCIVISCKKQDVNAKLDSPFNLSLNQSASIDSENLKINFLDVSDSRCPTGTQCFWTGEGLVDLIINNTTIQISTNHPTDTLGYSFSCGLSPYPEIDNEIKKKDYSIKLNITK